LTSVWPRIALRSVQVVLGASMLSMVASTVSFMRAPVASVERVSVPPAGVPESHPIEFFAGPIMQRSLFQSREGPALASSGALPQTKLDLELVGTLLSGQASGSIALVRDARQHVSAVREGERLVGSQTRVVGIEHRRIVIEHNGALETVALASELAEERVHAVKSALGIAVTPRAPAAAAASEGGILDALRAAATNVPPAPTAAPGIRATATPPEP
jgi:type II secretory pathway component PulC